MKFKISEEILEKYPDIRIGVLVAKNLKNKKVDPELENLKRTIENDVRNKYDTQTLSQHPFIFAWRETFRSFGAKPKDKPCSVEALLRRVLKEEKIPRINTAVDSYNLVSIKNVLPIGGYDLEKIEGMITLKVSKGGENFLPLGSSEFEETKEGEVIYADDKKVLTRKWNYRDCENAKITEEGKNIVLVIDAASKDIPKESVEKTLKDLSEMVGKFCGGEILTKIITKNDSEWEIEENI